MSGNFSFNQGGKTSSAGQSSASNNQPLNNIVMLHQMSDAVGDEICLDSIDSDEMQMISGPSGMGAFSSTVAPTGVDRLIHYDYFRDFPDYLDDDGDQ